MHMPISRLKNTRFKGCAEQSHLERQRSTSACSHRRFDGASGDDRVRVWNRCKRARGCCVLRATKVVVLSDGIALVGRVQRFVRPDPDVGLDEELRSIASVYAVVVVHKVYLRLMLACK
jgi:hypothetical protein